MVQHVDAPLAPQPIKIRWRLNATIRDTTNSKDQKTMVGTDVTCAVLEGGMRLVVAITSDETGHTGTFDRELRLGLIYTTTTTSEHCKVRTARISAR